MTAEIMKKMIVSSNGSQHDINHFLKVWGYAKTIAELEGVDAETRFILEVAAIVHDIACPSLRERFGFADGKKQEEEGPALAAALLAEFDLTPEELSRVLFLVGHHHTFEGIEGIDHRILVEADYLVNAFESGFSAENIRSAHDKIFKTASGKALLESIYGV